MKLIGWRRSVLFFLAGMGLGEILWDLGSLVVHAL